MTSREARELLGLPAAATAAEVEAAYRRRAWESHPDRGGEQEAFRRLVQARATLRCPAPVRVVVVPRPSLREAAAARLRAGVARLPRLVRPSRRWRRR